MVFRRRLNFPLVIILVSGGLRNFICPGKLAFRNAVPLLFTCSGILDAIKQGGLKEEGYGTTHGWSDRARTMLTAVACSCIQGRPSWGWKVMILGAHSWIGPTKKTGTQSNILSARITSSAPGSRGRGCFGYCITQGTGRFRSIGAKVANEWSSSDSTLCNHSCDLQCEKKQLVARYALEENAIQYLISK